MRLLILPPLGQLSIFSRRGMAMACIGIGPPLLGEQFLGEFVILTIILIVIQICILILILIPSVLY